MKYSLCDQYWNRYHDSFENIKDYALFIQVNMEETCKKHARNMIIYGCHIYYRFMFCHIGDKEIIKQRIP